MSLPAIESQEDVLELLLLLEGTLVVLLKNSSAAASPAALAGRDLKISILPIPHDGGFVLAPSVRAKGNQTDTEPSSTRLLLLVLLTKQQGSSERPRPLPSGCWEQGSP